MSTILDLYNRQIVAYIVRDDNNNSLVFNMFDKSIENNSNARPLRHLNIGFQYTNRTFHNKLENTGMTQSMSQVVKFINNDPMK